MHYILPIVPTSAKELALLNPGDSGTAAYRAIIRTIASLPGATLHIYTTEPQIRDALIPNATNLLYDPGLTKNGFPTPNIVVTASLRAFIHSGALRPDERVIVVNFRNIHLSKQSLLGLEDAVKNNPSSRFASFRQVRDHPVQFRAPFRLHGVESFVFLEEQNTGRSLLGDTRVTGDYRLSRPFFFDWRALGFWEEAPGCFAYHLGPDNSAISLYAITEPGRALRDGHIVFFRDSAFSARRVFLVSEVFGIELLAQTFYTPNSPLPLTFAYERSTGKLNWQIHDVRAGDSGIIRIWPMQASTVTERVDCTFGKLSLRSSGEIAVGAKLDGLVACLLTDPVLGAYDCLLPLDGAGLWGIDTATEKPISASTGQLLYNRQDFPTLHEHDFAVFAGPTHLLLDMDNQDAPWQAIVLDPHESNAICDLPDLPSSLVLRMELEGNCGTTGHSADVEDEAIIPSSILPDFPEFCVAFPSVAQALASNTTTFGTARVALAHLVWKYQHLSWRCQAFPSDGDPFFNWSVTTRHQQLSGLASYRLFEAEIRENMLSTEADRPKEQPFFKLLHTPGPKLPRWPSMMTSDNKKSAFIVTREPNQPGQLVAKNLTNGDLRFFGQPRVDYRSVWFDKSEGLLHALFIGNDEIQRYGIDSFDLNLQIKRSVLLPALLAGRPLLARLRGNAESFFLLDYQCRFLFEIGKHTSELLGVHGFFGGELIQDYTCTDDTLFATSVYDSVITIHNLRNGVSSHYTNPHTLFTSLLDYDSSAQRLYTVSRVNFPDDRRPCEHWLNCFSREGEFLGTHFLGNTLMFCLHSMEESSSILLADCEGNIFHYCPI